MMSKLIIAFVTLIMGIVFVGSIATQGLIVTEKTIISNESFDYTNKMNATGGVNLSDGPNLTITNAPIGWKTTDCPITDASITNSSGVARVLDTDYNFIASSGTIAMLATDLTNSSNTNGLNDSLISYTYCGDDYMNISWGRTMINLVSGFFAIAVLLISVALFYSVAKDAGIA